MSFSQWNEEEIILEFFQDRDEGRFLDLGAFDGITGSNTRALYEKGWGGVLVEANPENFAALANRYPSNARVQCLCAAISEKPGIVRFHHAPGQCGTCREDHHVAEYVNNNYYLAAVTAADIAARFGGKFDFVSIDVEGIELELLPSLSPVLESASLLCLEDAIPNQNFCADYYGKLLAAAAAHGFTTTVARTKPPYGGTGNTFLKK